MEHLPYSSHTNPGDLGPHTHLPHGPLSPCTMTGTVWHQEHTPLELVAVEYYLLLSFPSHVEEAGVIAKGNPPPRAREPAGGSFPEAVPGDLAFIACQCFAAEKKNPLFWGQWCTQPCGWSPSLTLLHA